MNTKLNNPLLEPAELPAFSKIEPAMIKPAIEILIDRNRAAIAEPHSAENSDWDSLIKPLQLMNDQRAVSVVDGLLRYLQGYNVAQFMETSRLDALSQVVVSLEYYLEALGEHRDDASAILDLADAQLQRLLTDLKPVEDGGQSGLDHGRARARRVSTSAGAGSVVAKWLPFG